MQSDNSANYALWDLAKIPDDPRETILPFMEGLLLDKALMIRFRAGLLVAGGN